jgi:hypothetical protein
VWAYTIWLAHTDLKGENYRGHFKVRVAEGRRGSKKEFSSLVEIVFGGIMIHKVEKINLI